MTKVAFYINNESISNVDCTSILDSNPGIGGTDIYSIIQPINYNPIPKAL